MPKYGLKTVLMASVVGLVPVVAEAQTVEELQRQIDELKAQVEALTAQSGSAPAASASQPELNPVAPPVAQTRAPAPADGETVVASNSTSEPAAEASGDDGSSRPWHDRIQVRGYTQMRLNEILSGDKSAPDGQSRLRSPHDRSVGDDQNFFLRRVRLVFQGDLNDYVSFYLQPDFATSVSNQSNGEQRDNYAQLRDAYVDVHLDRAHEFKFRFGQSKVPFGWENLQSSSNRLALDRTDGINSAAPSERELGVIAYYTPSRVQRIWDRLEEDDQKLFGNYGAFGLGVFNGQGVNRVEKNDQFMQVAMATWPFALDGLGGLFEGQVLEVGGALMRNRLQQEVRSGGVSDTTFKDERVGFHLVLYPQPLGFQAEWNWGRGPEFDVAEQAIEEKSLNGGYIQTMYRINDTSVGNLMPYARWQRYRGGWKAGTNAPRLETDEFEIGVEWQIMDPLEFTLAYAHMDRAEADERRLGRAEGDLIRAQLQWNY